MTYICFLLYNNIKTKAYKINLDLKINILFLILKIKVMKGATSLKLLDSYFILLSDNIVENFEECLMQEKNLLYKRETTVDILDTSSMRLKQKYENYRKIENMQGITRTEIHEILTDLRNEQKDVLKDIELALYLSTGFKELNKQYKKTSRTCRKYYKQLKSCKKLGLIKPSRDLFDSLFGLTEVEEGLKDGVERTKSILEKDISSLKRSKLIAEMLDI